MSNTKYAYSQISAAKLKKTPVKKRLGPALPKNGVSSQCGRGRHKECYSGICRCKKCPCEFNT